MRLSGKSMVSKGGTDLPAVTKGTVTKGLLARTHRVNHLLHRMGTALLTVTKGMVAKGTGLLAPSPPCACFYAASSQVTLQSP